MAHNRQSLSLTDRYRERLIRTAESLERLAADTWPTIDQLDGNRWAETLSNRVTQAQRDAVRATQAYLGAFLTLETGRRQSGPQIDSRQYAGWSRGGVPLIESFRSPLIAVLTDLKDGMDPDEALARGSVKAKRLVGVDFDNAHRTALLEAIDADDRFDGWTRAVRGTCGACAAVSARVSHGLHFEVHPACKCVSEPIVAGAPNTFPRPAGMEIFNGKSRDEQDEMLGTEAAELVRTGAVALPDLIDHVHMDDQPNFITQKPVSALGE